MDQQTLLMILMVAWGIITVVLACLLIYRATLSVQEDDQIYIHAAEQNRYEEQQALIARLTSLTKPIITLAVLSGVLLLASAGLWLYEGFKGS